MRALCEVAALCAQAVAAAGGPPGLTPRLEPGRPAKPWIDQSFDSSALHALLGRPPTPMLTGLTAQAAAMRPGGAHEDGDRHRRDGPPRPLRRRRARARRLRRRGGVPQRSFAAPPFGGGADALKGVRPLALDVATDDAVAMLADALPAAAAIVHLAGWHPPATAASTAADRRGLIETNVLGTQRVLDAARARGSVDVVVYASSFEIYGIPGAPGARLRR